MNAAKRATAVLAAAAITLSLPACVTGTATSAASPSPAEEVSAAYEGERSLVLSDDQVKLDGLAIAEEDAGDVTVSHDIVYYESGQGSDYGEGAEADEHDAEEAQAHTVVTRRSAGTYRLSGTLSQGQIAIDLGDDAEDDPDAVVTLILDGVDVTCTVAPALIFYNVYECGSSGETAGDGVLNITGDNEGLDTELHLTINGGVINIDAANDGINTNEDNVSVTTINGGTVVALGNMFDAISSDSEQNYLTLTLSEPVLSGDEVELTGADGSALFDFTAPKTASMILLSGAEIEDGAEYTLTVNGTEREYSSEGMTGAPGGMGDPGGMGEAPPDMGQAPDDMGRGRMDIPEGLEDWLSAATDVPDEIRTWLDSLIEMQNSTPPDEPQRGGESPLAFLPRSADVR